MTDVNPYQAPLSDVSRDGDGIWEEEGTLAERTARLAAQIGDHAAFLIPFSLLVFVVYMRQAGLIPVIAGMLIIGGALGVINLVMLHRSGQTLGKRVAKIRIVRYDGERASLVRTFLLRYLVLEVLGIVTGIGPLFRAVDALFIFRRDRRCIHDMIAGTIVVRADIPLRGQTDAEWQETPSWQ